MSAKPSKTLASRAAAKPAQRPARTLLADLRELILQAREGVARTVDAGLALHYWQVGRRIRQDILKEKRAEYGKKIFHSLSGQLTAEFGRGYSERNLANMVRFAEVFPDPKILQSLVAKLGWTHFQKIIYLDDPLKRDFYAEMCRMEKWNTRNWLRKHEQSAGEEEPIGLILCAGKSQQHVELLELEKSGIHVASYWTKVLPKKLLEQKLHDAVRLARARLEAGKD